MSTESVGELSPQALCRRMLTALRQRLPADPELSYLEMLLLYFIDRAPTPAAFATLLARYVADARPGIADAAAVLQQAWERAHAEPAAALPPLAETLRVLGALADEVGAPFSMLDVRTDEAQVRLYDVVRDERLDARALQQQSAARAALRGQVSPEAAGAPLRYEPLLRAVGALLAAEAAQTYQVIVTPQLIAVEGSAGYFGLFPTPQLAAQAHAAAQARAAPPSTPQPGTEQR